jgi:hypothetical protein
MAAESCAYQLSGSFTSAILEVATIVMTSSISRTWSLCRRKISRVVGKLDIMGFPLQAGGAHA